MMKLLRSRRVGLGLLAAALLSGMAYVGARSGPLAASRVTVVQASEGTFAPALFGIGTVEARRAYLIGPTAAGRVSRVAVDVGDAVEAGQLLAEMDPVDLDERSVALDAAVARAGSVVAAMQAQHHDALARHELATANARRYAELGEQNFISAGAVEARLQERTSAQAGVKAAEANLAAARQDWQRLAAERAGLVRQRHNLRLVAPSNGVVIAREAEKGSTVVAGQAVLRIVEPASLWVRVRLDQGRSTALATGLDASIVLRSNPSTAIPGRVARVEATSDSVTEERIALVSFDALPEGLTIGEQAEVTLTLPPTSPALLLPNASIRRHGGQAGVWRLEGDRLQFVALRLGPSSLDGRVQVQGGLRAGDRVVLYSERELDANSRIEVVDALVGAGA